MSNPKTKFSKKRAPAQVLSSVLDRDRRFEDLIKLLPVELEDLALKIGSIKRKRKLRSAVDLVRLVLVYALTDWSLRLVGAWTALWGIGLSDVAVLKRLQSSLPLLSELVSRLIKRQWGENGEGAIRVIDATTVSGPGAKTAEWRLHVSFKLGQMVMDEVELTDPGGGETLRRHEIREGDTVIGDRIYSTKKSISKVIESGAALIIRVNWQNLPLYDDLDNRLSVLEWQREAGEGELLERRAYLKTEEGAVPLRLICCRVSEKVAEKTRRRMCKEARRKGYKLSPESLEAAGYLALVSNIWDWEAGEVFSLYRYRWQIELLFKRLKSIFKLDQLRAKDKRLASAYLLGKLLAYLLAEVLYESLKNQAGPLRPLSPWRLLCWFRNRLIQTVEGQLTGEVTMEKLKRYFTNSPRRRPNQWATAQQLACPAPYLRLS